MPHPISKWPARPLSHSLHPGYKSGLRVPVQCRFSLELVHCSNSIPHSNKFLKIFYLFFIFLFTFHLFTFHGLIHLLNGITQKRIHTEITLSDNSSILALENSFLYKIESKQLIHLICDQVSRLCYNWVCHTSNTRTHTHPCVCHTSDTHTQALCSEHHTERKLWQAPPCRLLVLQDKAVCAQRHQRPSRMRMTTRGLGVSRLVCKNALHFHLDCSELFSNRITDKCSETGNSLTFKTKPEKPSLNSNSKVEY